MNNEMNNVVNANANQKAYALESYDQCAQSALLRARNHLGWNGVGCLYDGMVYGIYREDDGYNLSSHKADGMYVSRLSDGMTSMLSEFGLTDEGRVIDGTVYSHCGYGSFGIANLSVGVFYARSCGGHWIKYNRGIVSTDTLPSESSWDDKLIRSQTGRLKSRCRRLFDGAAIDPAAMTAAREADIYEAEVARLQAGVRKVKAGYSGTRLFAAIKRAGLGLALEPGYRDVCGL